MAGRAALLPDAGPAAACCSACLANTPPLLLLLQNAPTLLLQQLLLLGCTVLRRARGFAPMPRAAAACACCQMLLIQVKSERRGQGVPKAAARFTFKERVRLLLSHSASSVLPN